LYQFAIQAVSLGLIGYGLWKRRRLGLSCDLTFTGALVPVCFGIGTALIGGAFPVLYLLILNAVRGGPIESNLPPGLTPDSFLGLLMAPIVLSLVYAFYGYTKHLKS